MVWPRNSTHSYLLADPKQTSNSLTLAMGRGDTGMPYIAPHTQLKPWFTDALVEHVK